MALALFLTIALTVGVCDAAERIHHDLHVQLQPHQHSLHVTDTITLPAQTIRESEYQLHFVLHAGVNVTSPTPGTTITTKPGPTSTIPLDAYTITLPASTESVILHYSGEIYHPLAKQGEEYARSFNETLGLISSQGVYLAGPTAWYPQTDDKLLTFTLEVQLPSGWSAVSQGKRTKFQEQTDGVQLRWESPEPQDEIFLIAGMFTEYRETTGDVDVMAFLQTPDAALANTYLTITTQYLDMYSALLGPYLYPKFALVENFWETGYGMPSFTLLGPKIIRFPFIRHSSYPHEILHNWWGRGTYVDFESGNWSEGLTAYLADHLIKEQRGMAVDYRRTTLQQYADYVAEAKDIPLTEFRSRHSAVTQAIGYGKTLMFFHMLRLQLGDETFVNALRSFYRENTFRHATFGDLQKAFEQLSGIDLTTEFAQWVTRPGAPSLRISDSQTTYDGATYRLTATLEQTQPGPTYALNIPIAISGKNEKATHQQMESMTSRVHTLDVRVPFQPLRVDVDPEFDIFRRLHRTETPPALTQAFGANKVMILLPSQADAVMLQGYRKLAEEWKASQPSAVDIRMDNVVQNLPHDHAVWVFGWKNRFHQHIITALAEYDVSITKNGVQIGTTNLTKETHSIVLSARRTHNQDLALTWVGTENVAALPGLGRKLPHYGKYSYLGFAGAEPTNTLKGQWPTINSPLSIAVTIHEGLVAERPTLRLAPRHALATLPELFSPERMLDTITWLADKDRQGRGLGTSELEHVTTFISDAFRDAGLTSAGDAKDPFLQTWKEDLSDDRKDVVMHNVLGVIPGTNPAFAGQSVVVGAHYDHLGFGWPDVHVGDEGKIHHGADDNASGVAVLLELARILGKNFKPERTVMFAAFSGEEDGLRGSRHYVAHERRFPADKARGMLNLDTVGRLEHGKLLVLGTSSAREWIHIFMGAGYVTGVPITSVAEDFGSSDQKSFLDHGVPAVQFFTGPHLDYHRPTDTVDKIDSAGLVQVATVVKEAIEYLADRPNPLHSTLTSSQSKPSSPHSPPRSTRTVSLGTIPDFTYQDTGVRISGVTPGSPAEQAGLKTADIIVQLETTAIHDLRDFSTALSTLQPGDRIQIMFTRVGTQYTTHATVVAR